MAWAVLTFNAQVERVVEVGMVLLVGGTLLASFLSLQAVVLVLLLFLVIRPISVALALAGSNVKPVYRNLMAWFGIRGIGSFYYLMFAIQQGLPFDEAVKLAQLVFIVIAASIVAHGISATPLMKLYSGIQSRGRRKESR
jgi:NhaP-type Na+/H+ or K+/H+ antiporter